MSTKNIGADREFLRILLVVTIVWLIFVLAGCAPKRVTFSTLGEPPAAPTMPPTDGGSPTDDDGSPTDDDGGPTNDEDGSPTNGDDGSPTDDDVDVTPPTPPTCSVQYHIYKCGNKCYKLKRGTFIERKCKQEREKEDHEHGDDRHDD